MQTYAVHNRRSDKLLADLRWRGTALFQVILLSMLLAPLLHVGFTIVVIAMALSGHLAWSGLDLWSLSCGLVLVVGHSVAIAANLVGLARTGQQDLSPWQFLLPFYWALIGVATLIALREFALRPFHWFKTPHEANVPLAPAKSPQQGGNQSRSLALKANWLPPAA